MASVVFTEPAEYDLLDIEYYIYVDLCNHQAAERISNGILDAAEKLGEYPIGHPLVNRSEEHTSELQSHHEIVCRLLLEKKKKINTSPIYIATC